MLFTDVLEVHDSFASEASNRDILGDGFLMESNPIYRSVRLLSNEIGCTYIEAYPEYLLLPFHELPKIVESRKVPYVPAARLMRSVERGRPGIFTTDDVPMPESYHMHEAAHVIADHLFAKVKASGQQEAILKSMMAESFANTVDALAAVQAQDEIHRYFIKQNSYMHPQKKTQQAINSLIGAMGMQMAFMLVYYSYLHANFLTKPLSKKIVQELIERYVPDGKVNAKLQKDIRAVCEIGEKLDLLFRMTTTANYFKQQGFEGDIQDLLDFPFMKIIAGNKAFAEAIESLAGSIAR